MCLYNDVHGDPPSEDPTGGHDSPHYGVIESNDCEVDVLQLPIEHVATSEEDRTKERNEDSQQLVRFL